MAMLLFNVVLEQSATKYSRYQIVVGFLRTINLTVYKLNI